MNNSFLYLKCLLLKPNFEYYLLWKDRILILLKTGFQYDSQESFLVLLSRHTIPPTEFLNPKVKSLLHRIIRGSTLNWTGTRCPCLSPICSWTFQAVQRAYCTFLSLEEIIKMKVCVTRTFVPLDTGAASKTVWKMRWMQWSPEKGKNKQTAKGSTVEKKACKRL